MIIASIKVSVFIVRNCLKHFEIISKDSYFHKSRNLFPTPVHIDSPIRCVHVSLVHLTVDFSRQIKIMISTVRAPIHNANPTRSAMWTINKDGLLADGVLVHVVYPTIASKCVPFLSVLLEEQWKKRMLMIELKLTMATQSPPFQFGL
jgi:hypothetical protein